MADFLVIGAMKGGTTSLYEYLSAHHQIDLISVKELNFYNNETHWARGRKWYEQRFANNGKLRGDVNPNYAMYPLCKDVPARIHSLYPHCKIIYLLREPVSRTISHIQHNVTETKEQRPLDQIVSKLEQGTDPFNYVGNSRYYFQLEQFLKYFPMNQVSLISSADLKDRRAETLATLVSFLGLEDFRDEQVYSHVIHQGKDKRQHAAWLRQIFHNRKLGGVAGFAVRSAKQILPTKIYNAVRTSISSQPITLDVSSEHRQSLNEMLQKDIEQLTQLTGRKFW